MKELICIVCPNGCHLKVDEENGYNVTGNKCERGAEYGKAELLHPMRMVTSTVRIEGAPCRRLPGIAAHHRKPLCLPHVVISPFPLCTILCRKIKPRERKDADRQKQKSSPFRGSWHRAAMTERVRWTNKI